MQWQSPIGKHRYKGQDKGEENNVHFYIGAATEEDALNANRNYTGAFQPLGVQSEKHAITIAASRTGKGAGVIIPNLLRWPHSALVVDPKGENAEATAEHREKMGQKVYVLDPFETANVPERLRASVNLLAELDPKSPRIREDINVIADGLVMRHDPKSGFWDGGGLSVIAGLIAHVLTGQHNLPKTLPSLREFLTANVQRFESIVDEMEENDSCGRLAKTAAGKLTKTGNEAGHFLSVADENTKWLDSPAMENLLADSTFSLRDLKRENVTVYLVLPPDLLDEHGRFLRLFVRCAIAAMAQPINGNDKGVPCLFLLDEFPALGHISEIHKASGLMPGFGVHLWPFVQDIGQLFELYGHDGTHTFFSNADLHQFFGCVDKPTLEYVSKALGRFSFTENGESVDDALASFPNRDNFANNSEGRQKFIAAYAKAEIRMKAAVEIQSQLTGIERLPADEVAHLIAKRNGQTVANASINFVKGSVFKAEVMPYFAEREERTNPLKEAKAQQTEFLKKHPHGLMGRGHTALAEKGRRKREAEAKTFRGRIKKWMAS